MILSFVFALVILSSNTTIAQQSGTGTPKGQGKYFVDQNGDGICDNFGTKVGQKNSKKANGTGVCNGTGNGTVKGTGVCNGTGKGTGVCNGTGVCDGTGSGTKGMGNRSGKK